VPCVLLAEVSAVMAARQQRKSSMLSGPAVILILGRLDSCSSTTRSPCSSPTCSPYCSTALFLSLLCFLFTLLLHYCSPCCSTSALLTFLFHYPAHLAPPQPVHLAPPLLFTMLLHYHSPHLHYHKPAHHAPPKPRSSSTLLTFLLHYPAH
jgi:hypothetical protein